MTAQDPYDFIKALIAKDFEADHHAAPSQPQEPLIITLSRDYGARGEAIAEKLADCLRIPLYDHEILERVAAKAKVDAFKLEEQDETVSAGISTFLYSLLTGTAGEMQTYRRHLYGTVLELAQQDCLLVGRGAHLILSGRKIFRLRIVGSKLVCAKRVAADTGQSLLEAERKVYEANTKRHKSIQAMFGDSFEHCALEFAKNFDLVINTDHISADCAVSLALFAMQQSGFNLRQRLPAA
jgi:hypothetical protein